MRPVTAPEWVVCASGVVGEGVCVPGAGGCPAAPPGQARRCNERTDDAQRCDATNEQRSTMHVDTDSDSGSHSELVRAFGFGVGSDSGGSAAWQGHGRGHERETRPPYAAIRATNQVDTFTSSSPVGNSEPREAHVRWLGVGVLGAARNLRRCLCAARRTDGRSVSASGRCRCCRHLRRRRPPRWPHLRAVRRARCAAVANERRGCCWWYRHWTDRRGGTDHG